jgi:hypothetical protein
MPDESVVNNIITQIAKEELSINTLETQNSDSLDFHILAVWEIKEALRKAYFLGFCRERQIHYAKLHLDKQP